MLDNVKGYRLLETMELSDIKSVGYRLVHEKTGARIAVIQNDDDNKVFTIGFRTPPSDDTGLPHIMEHSVLCGSREFPVKDPFVELAKGSLNTFLNAMTYPDRTVYPVASCNDQDFKNLMHIYLDAVFYPAIYEHEEIFRQEGWSYNLEGRDEPITYNGVVYNEMKGAFSSPDGILEREIQNTLYPDTSYAFESGGNPDSIPELTYEQFIAFHKKYYHPSNSYIYLYGNADMEERLAFIDEHYLSHFACAEVDSEIAVQKSLPDIVRREIRYPVADASETEEGSYYAYNKVVGDVLDRRTAIAFNILDYALLSAPGAPIVRALLEKGIGEDVYGFFEQDVRQPFFSVIAKNAKSGQEDVFVETIEETLREIVENGIDEKALEAAINSSEFKIREAEYGRYPKGLMYGLQIFSSWIHDDDAPFLHIQVLDEFRWLREQMHGSYFTDLIRERILDNKHGSVIVSSPVVGLTKEGEEKVAAKLADVKAGLDEAGIEEMIASTQALMRYKDEPDTEEDMAKIPMLKRSDIRREVAPFSNEEREWDKGTFLYHRGVDNGIAYIRLLFDISAIEEKDWPILGLFVDSLGMIDTKNYSYTDFNSEVGVHTGGIAASVSQYSRHNDDEKIKTYLVLSGKALEEKVPVMMSLIREMMLETNWDDTRRLREILGQEKASLQGKFMSAGHTVAMTRSSAHHSLDALFREKTEGIAFYRSVCELADAFDEKKDELIASLQSLVEKVFHSGGMILSFMGSEGICDAVRDCVDQVVSELPVGEGEDAFLSGTLLPSGKEAFATAAKVQYVARTGRYDYEKYPYTGAMHVLRTIMNYEYLWNEVRVKGGAYGCMSAFLRGGRSYMISYRDPHLHLTNEVYQNAPHFLETMELNEKELTKYVIGSFGASDAPKSAEAKHARNLLIYLCGFTEEILQKERDEAREVTADDIRALAPCVQAFLDCEEMCVIGGESSIEKNREMFTSIEKLL